MYEACRLCIIAPMDAIIMYWLGSLMFALWKLSTMLLYS